MVQEIAIRVRLREQERVGLAEYERIVGSVASVAAVVAWLPMPESRLVLRGRGAEPVRLETLSYGSVFEMLVVLDQRSPAVERAAAAVAALVDAVRDEAVADDAAGVAGELDRLDRAAPRGRSGVERSLRAFLEGARSDVLARRTTTRVRAAQALLRLAEDGAEIIVERVDDALAPEVSEAPVEAAAETGSVVVLAEPGAPDDTELGGEEDQDVEKQQKKKKKKKSDKKKPGKKQDEEQSEKKDGKTKKDKGKGKEKHSKKKHSKKS
ncbi:hypothetical protein HUN59_08580 [Curtobacterium sp. Csp2]|uniref:hypothetical protein n=1 Tax=Curtobacterium sp. Csp2 TaxID=2495430 RepID=UPI001580C450|nr:hypothetical protein [Curtobacterium sp. Csp2]QKS16266.1 hypothetical protein HUN59_08580 [Curtobacterium sp. Csp2]